MFIYFFLDMILKTEIKDFVKKVLMIWILLSFFINLLVTYFAWAWSEDTYASANSNETKFKKVNSWYLWTVWVAVSLNVGTKQKTAKDAPVSLTTEVLPISYILANKTVSRNKIITANMVSINEYLNILRTDVNKLLDQSSDRQAMLESYLDQLKLRYDSAQEQISVLKQQSSQLTDTMNSSDQSITRIKNDLNNSYKSLDYDKTESSLDEYLSEKDKNTYSRTYLVFIWKFIQSYTILNEYNKVAMDTIVNNKDALIKNVTIILPDSSTKLMKKFNLVKTEADFKKAMSN